MKETKILFQLNQIETESLKKQTGTEADSIIPTKSLWESTSTSKDGLIMKAEELPSKTQVLIIGGGMAGVLTAYQLKQKGIDAIVIEKGEVGRTCTANTTAKITSLHGAIYQQITKAYGQEKAKKYYDIQQKSIEDYQAIIQACNLSCDFELKSHIMFATKDEEKLRKEYECQKQLGIPVEWVDHSPLPFEILGGIMFRNQAQFHPLHFLDQLIKNLKVYTNCQATRIDSDGTVEVNHSYQVKADSVVIATHYPIINSKGFYFTRLSQDRSYALALKQAGGFDIHDMYIDMEEKGHSFRPYQDYLIMVMGNHRSGQKKVPAYYKHLEGEAMKWFPKAKVKYHWSNQDCMSLDHIPYIGQYSKSLPNFYVATGFNQWGMSNSMTAANIISELIASGTSEYADVVSPSRNQLSGAGAFLANGAISVVNLSKQLLHIKEDELKQIKKGDAGIIKLEGSTIGVYKDMAGELHMVDTKCSHLGCQLQWNPNEKTWDCPCHGSRFDIEGRLIEDPAQKDLNTACCLKKTEGEK